jgi:hypothetical protein
MGEKRNGPPEDIERIEEEIKQNNHNFEKNKR